jgi:hypothetical protein
MVCQHATEVCLTDVYFDAIFPVSLPSSLTA